MNVNRAGNADVGGGNPNDGVADYYMNIFGNLKKLISCTIVNPSKGFILETGDIITFTDMPVEMFGADFSTSKYYMVIETKRSQGKVSITAREVG